MTKFIHRLTVTYEADHRCTFILQMHAEFGRKISKVLPVYKATELSTIHLYVDTPHQVYNLCPSVHPYTGLWFSIAVH